MNASTTPRPNRRRTVAIALVAATLTVGGAGTAIAANPGSAAGQAVEQALGLIGVDWSGMPEGYTRDQYVAFWGAGYTAEDADALGELWGTELTETKARAGQALLDGQTLPVPPSGPAATDAPADDAPAEEPADEAAAAQLGAYVDAGYTYEDAEALAALWSTDLSETKARAGQLLLEGQTLPVPPSSAPAGS